MVAPKDNAARLAFVEKFIEEARAHRGRDLAFRAVGVDVAPKARSY